MVQIKLRGEIASALSETLEFRLLSLPIGVTASFALGGKLCDCKIPAMGNGGTETSAELSVT